MPLAISSTTTEFITLAEVKQHANIPASNTADDMELERFRSAAQEHVESLVGPVLWRSVTDTVHAHGGVVVLPLAPVVSVESLTSSGVAVTYALRKAAGLLLNVRASGDLDLSFTAGRESCPDAIRVAALVIAEHLWRTQRGGQSESTALPGEDFGGVAPGLGYAIPNRALELLSPYLLPPAVG